MRGNNEKLQAENGTAFAFASFLLNLLILLILSGSVWTIHSIIAQSNTFGMVIREIALR